MERIEMRPFARARAAIRLLGCAGVLLCASTLLAQRTFRNLSGVVKDRHREPLRGAVVLLENESTHSVLSCITDKGGRYSFKRIDADSDYILWSTYRGQKSKTKSLDLFDSRKNPNVDLVIRLP